MVEDDVVFARALRRRGGGRERERERVKRREK
jgi:hypothetical protein